MGFDHDMVQRALAQAGGNEQLAINLILNGEVHGALTASSSSASIAAAAESFSGPASGFGSAFAPAVGCSGPASFFGSAFAPSESCSGPASGFGSLLPVLALCFRVWLCFCAFCGLQRPCFQFWLCFCACCELQRPCFQVWLFLLCFGAFFELQRPCFRVRLCFCACCEVQRPCFWVWLCFCACCVLNFLRYVQRSRVFRSPHRQTRVTCPRRRRQAAVAQGAARANNAPARAHAGGGVVLRAAIARHEAKSGRTAAAPRPHARAVFAVCTSARHVRLRGDRVPSTGHRACRYARVDDGALGCVDNGACDAGSREESAGAAASARVLCCALRLSCHCLRALRV